MNALEKYVAKKVLVEKLAASIPGVPKVPGVPGVPKQSGATTPKPLGSLKMPTVGDVRQRVMAKRPSATPTAKPVGVPGFLGQIGSKSRVPPRPTAVAAPSPSFGQTSKPGPFTKKREIPVAPTPR